MLSGRLAIVTGATSGNRHGHRQALCEGGRARCRPHRLAAQKVRACEADITAPAPAERAVAEAVRTWAA